MPRQARLDVPGALHHIMIRGINKADIFCDDEDRQKFLEKLALNITDAKCAIFAWTLMSDHIHLLFKSGEKGISSVMRKQLTWYAIYFNRKYRRTGHLFENRYKSILCEEDSYLLALLRYIHLNPLRAGIVKNVKELEDYPWSGHSVIMGKGEYEWMNVDYVLSQFGKSRKRARTAYRKFMLEEVKTGQVSEITGGELGNHDRWSEVVSLKRNREESESDSRILGDSDFIKNILEEAEEKEKRQLKIRRSSRSILDIVSELSTASGISQVALRHGSRKRKVSRVRAEIARRCTEELGMTAADIARYLGVSTSAIIRAIVRIYPNNHD